MKKTDVAVIGSGASGIICACTLAKRYKSVSLFEITDRVGKKILVTGNGRCNLTNINANESCYNESARELIKILFSKYGPQYVLDYFDKIGLKIKIESDGRVYPLSKQSSAVLSVLRNELKRENVFENVNTKIKGIKKSGEFYEIATENEKVLARKIVIATGGKADHAGRENKNTQNILDMLNVKTNKLSPTLSPVNVESSIIKSLKGIRVEGEVSLYKNNELIKSEKGEIQFTQNALSGICVFNLSRIANRDSNCFIRVSLLPDISDKELKDMLTQRIELVKDESAVEIFTGLFHKNIATALLKHSGIDANKNANALSDREMEKLSKAINHFDFVCKKREDFSNAQATCGGVPIKEINPNTFELNSHKNVYVIGEALDVDGDCGGYNLQFAFASGLCVGETL